MNCHLISSSLIFLLFPRSHFLGDKGLWIPICKSTWGRGTLFYCCKQYGHEMSAEHKDLDLLGCQAAYKRNAFLSLRFYSVPNASNWIAWNTKKHPCFLLVQAFANVIKLQPYINGATWLKRNKLSHCFSVHSVKRNLGTVWKNVWVKWIFRTYACIFQRFHTHNITSKMQSFWLRKIVFCH